MTHSVLVIEDNPITRKVVRLSLGEAGFAVVEAATAAEGLAAATRAPPDLVLQDLQLPDLDGLELIAQLRALPDLHDVPIVAFSGFLAPFEYGRAIALGFTDFIPKPIEPGRLVDVIRMHLPVAAPGVAVLGAGRRVLLADDDPVQLKVGRLRLRGLGFVVETARDGVQALEILRRVAVDAVVSDILMPRMDGFRLCAEIRRDPALAHLPVVLASSTYVDEADRLHAARTGATAFASRSPDLAGVLAALAKALAAPAATTVRIATPSDTAEQRDRVVQQLERQAVMNSAFAHRATMQASMLSVAASLSEALTRHDGHGDSPAELLAILLDASGISCGALYTTSVDEPGLVLGAAMGFSGGVRQALVDFGRDHAIAAPTISAQEPRLVGGPLVVPEERRLLAALEVASLLLVPLTNGSECVGLLLFAAPDLMLAGPDWVPFSRTIAVQLGQALVLARTVRRLASSARFARALIDRASECIVTADVHGRLRESNAAGERLFGVPREQLVGRSIFDVIGADGDTESRAWFEALLRDGSVVGMTRRFARPDGRVVVASISGSVVEIDGERTVVSILHDLTEPQRLADEERLLHAVTLAASEASGVLEMFDVVLRTVGEHGDWTIAAAWCPVAGTDTLACEHVWTRDAAERPRLAPMLASTFARGVGLLGRAWASQHPCWTRDLVTADACPRSAIAASLGLHAGLVVPIVVDGEVVAVFEMFKATPGDDPASATWATALATQLGSVIGRKRDQEARRASEARFDRLWVSGVVGIGVADLAGNMYEANDTLLAMAGVTRATLEAGQLRWTERIAPEARTAVAAAVDSLRTRGNMQPLELSIVRPDATSIPLLIGVAMLDATRCLVFATDLTERAAAEAALRRSDEQLRQAQKMEAVGRLAGGIAHDFNNILSVIVSYANMVAEDLPEAAPMRTDVDEICKAANRAAGLTRQLLMFSRQQVLAPVLLDLDHVIEDTEKMLRRVVGEDIVLTLVSCDGLGLVFADPGSIEQVLMNLVVNARDAMPTGGKLTIRTARVVLQQHDDRVGGTCAAGPYAMLAVTDTGTGMTAATQARIFEPFFTTKPQGKGTGLGLSTVFGIVQQALGTVAVHSELDVGTTFEIYLPISADAPAEAVAVERVHASTRGTETILLVEDDLQVRAVARAILRNHGYAVVEASNAGEALLYAEGPDKLDLLLTDVVMPHMSGPALAKRIGSVRPEMKIVCMSGCVFHGS